MNFWIFFLKKLIWNYFFLFLKIKKVHRSIYRWKENGVLTNLGPEGHPLRASSADNDNNERQQLDRRQPNGRSNLNKLADG